MKVLGSIFLGVFFSIGERVKQTIMHNVPVKEFSTEKEQLSMKKRESMKLKESARNATQGLRNHRQCAHLLYLQTDSLELKLA